jgi:hypothetical protein
MEVMYLYFFVPVVVSDLMGVVGVSVFVSSTVFEVDPKIP